MVLIVVVRLNFLISEAFCELKCSKLPVFDLKRLFCLVVLCCFSLPVSAQSNKTSDGALKQAKEKFDQGSEKNSPLSNYLPPSVDGLNSSVVEEPEQKPTQSDQGQLEIYIKTVTLQGGTVFKPSVLAYCYSDLLRTTVNETHLANITDCLTSHYQKAGYSLSRAIIPPQDVAGGRLLIRIVEGYISNVRFEGGDPDQFGIRKFSTPLMKPKPLTQAHLERYLLLISDAPGVSLEDTSLEEQGEMTGAFELTISIKTWQVWSGGEIDNRGSDSIGPYQSYQNLALNSLFGFGESIQFSYSSILDSMDELNFGAVSIDLPLNVHGMRLSAFLSGSVSKPNDDRKLTNTEFKTLDAGVNLNWNLLRTRESNLWVGAGIWARNNQEQNDFGTYVDDTLHGLSFYLRFNKNDKWGGENFFYANLRQGLDLGNVSKEGDIDLSRYDGDGEFTKFYADVSRNQVINDNWSLYFSGVIQLASHSLLSSQEFYFGGSRFGRAYESGVVSGDGGAAASLELRYSRDLDFGLLNGVQLYGFADVGTVWDRSNDFIDDAVLSSAGFGARLYFDYGIEADIAAAFPIDDADLTEAKDAEFFFRLSRNYKLSELRFDQPLSMLREAYQK